MNHYVNLGVLLKSTQDDIRKEYDYLAGELSGQLIHFDAWRLESVDELQKLGIQEYIKPGNVIAVEWAGSAESFFKKLSNNQNVLLVNIQIDYLSESQREIKIYEAN